MQVAQLTDYPKLYGDTYWGRFKVKDEAGTSRIIRNRNAFAVKYCIEAYTTASTVLAWLKEGLGAYADHIEIYRTAVTFTQPHKRYIVLTSPYDRQDGACIREMPPSMVAAGFKNCAQLYHPMASTYRAVFDTPRELKLAARMLAAQALN